MHETWALSRQDGPNLLLEEPQLAGTDRPGAINRDGNFPHPFRCDPRQI